MTRTKNGLPGIYNASGITLPDGAGAAVALNERGEIIADTTSSGAVTTPINARKTVAASATPERLAASSTPVVSVVISALSTNTTYVAVGGANTVTAATASQNAALLAPNDSITMENVDLFDLWVAVATNGEGVAYNATQVA